MVTIAMNTTSSIDSPTDITYAPYVCHGVCNIAYHVVHVHFPRAAHVLPELDSALPPSQLWPDVLNQESPKCNQKNRRNESAQNFVLIPRKCFLLLTVNVDIDNLSIRTYPTGPAFTDDAWKQVTEITATPRPERLHMAFITLYTDEFSRAEDDVHRCTGWTTLSALPISRGLLIARIGEGSSSENLSCDKSNDKLSKCIGCCSPL